MTLKEPAAALRLEELPALASDGVLLSNHDADE